MLSKENDLTEISKIEGRNFYNDGCGVASNGNCNLFISFPEDIAYHQIHKYNFEGLHFSPPEVLQERDFDRNALVTNPAYTSKNIAQWCSVVQNNQMKTFGQN